MSGQVYFMNDPFFVKKTGTHRDSGRLVSSGWQHQKQEFDEGVVEFTSAGLGTGIVVTQSHCSLKNDFCSVVQHEVPVVILSFCLRGHSRYGVDKSGKDNLLAPNDIWLYRPDDKRMNRKTLKHDSNYTVAMKFSADRVADLMSEMDDGGIKTISDGGKALRINGITNVDDLLQPLLSNPMESALDKIMAESSALSVLATCLETVPSRQMLCEANLIPAERRSLHRVMDMLLENMSEPPSLALLSAEAGMDHTRLNSCFKKAFGCTVFEWLRQRRLFFAKNLLRQDQQNITEIAHTCGFCSSSHFGTSFRAQFGCTPRQYRRCLSTETYGI